MRYISRYARYYTTSSSSSSSSSDLDSWSSDESPDERWHYGDDQKYYWQFGYKPKYYRKRVHYDVPARRTLTYVAPSRIPVPTRSRYRTRFRYHNVDPCDYRWEYQYTDVKSGVEFYKKGDMLLDYTPATGTVKTTYYHPTRGRTQLIRRYLTDSEFISVLLDPRTHTGPKYRRTVVTPEVRPVDIVRATKRVPEGRRLRRVRMTSDKGWLEPRYRPGYGFGYGGYDGGYGGYGYAGYAYPWRYGDYSYTGKYGRYGSDTWRYPWRYGTYGYQYDPTGTKRIGWHRRSSTVY